ncbi:MAG TPA: hypothetical protein VM864_01455 [Pyrinomonadaceae bacterium]|jgi:hypothetical protein|nr:hypothetical protein [Pyrinomonadaceae bacterium]
MKPRKLIASARAMVMMLLIVSACAVTCMAQTRTAARQRSDVRQPSAARSRAQTRGEADEDFELNIVERRITEPDFFASTEVSAGEAEARGLNLRVGVAVGAERIDVLLRNVRGHVRFRASLDALRRMLDARRAAQPTNEAPPAVP